MTIAAFERALSNAHSDKTAPQPDCAGWPESYVDYDRAPTDEYAQMLCSECPLFDLCAANARATRPGWGVYAGEHWEYGRRVSKAKRAREAAELRTAS